MKTVKNRLIAENLYWICDCIYSEYIHHIIELRCAECLSQSTDDPTLRYGLSKNSLKI